MTMSLLRLGAVASGFTASYLVVAGGGGGVVGRTGAGDEHGCGDDTVAISTDGGGVRGKFAVREVSGDGVGKAVEFH